MAKTILLVLLLRLVFGEPDVKGPCVTTSLGQVCGTRETFLEKSISVYYGIPYAEPPVGHLRFKPPKEGKAWNKVVDGTRIAPMCSHPNPEKNLFPLPKGIEPTGEQSEDCLYLNIFAPNKAADLPVMFWIHGGCFWIGSGSLSYYDGRVLAALENVVVVTINYRLGLLGFGYLDMPEMPGNMGLLDQRMALEWVHEHIASFGGNPNMVTIFGVSAGGASVSAHILAPGSQHLFTAAAAQSGAVFNPWAMDGKEKAMAKTKRLANEMECDFGTNQEILDCLVDKPVEEMGNFTIFPTFALQFPAVVVDNDRLFFGKPVADLLAKSDFSSKRYVIGTNADESSMFMLFGNPTRFSLNDPWSIDHSEYKEFAKAAVEDLVRTSQASKAVAYYDDLSRCGSYERCLRELYSDFSMGYGSYVLANGLAMTSKQVYVYLLNETMKGYPDHLGCAHLYDIPLIFGEPFIDPDYSDEKQMLSHKMMDIWTRFGANGISDPSWPAVKYSKPVTVKLFTAATDAKASIPGYKKEEYDFWSRLLGNDLSVKEEL